MIAAYQESDFFRCERFRCTMLKIRCVARQEMVGEPGRARCLECLDCRQGKEIREEGGKVRRSEGQIPADARIKEKKMGECKIEGCEKKTIAQGLCGMHYDRWRRGEKEVLAAMGRAFKVIRPLKTKQDTRPYGLRTEKAEKRTKKKGTEKQDVDVAAVTPTAPSVETRGMAEKLAEEHWEYIAGLMRLHEIPENEMIGWHYRTAFVHGYKHGREEAGR